jgi:hypothetical protein
MLIVQQRNTMHPMGICVPWIILSDAQACVFLFIEKSQTLPSLKVSAFGCLRRRSNPSVFSQPNVAKIKWRWSGNAMQTVPPSEGGSRGRRGFGGVWWRAVLQIETTGDWLAPGLFAVEKPPVVADKCSVLAGWGGVVLRGTLEKID